MIQFKPRARSVHTACQAAVIRIDGEQGGGLKCVLKNFSMANQRFESEEGVARRIACTIQASMLFLTSEAEDMERTLGERENAVEILTVFNPEDLTLYGLEADLAGHSTELIRFFDVKLPDPALLPRRVRRFVNEVKLLFFTGRILHKASTSTVTAIVLQQLSNKRATFVWKNEVRSFGWVGDHAAVRRALRRVQTLTRLLIECLQLEFHDDLFPQWWEAFDLYCWQGVSPGSSEDARLWSKFNKLCRSRSMNEIQAAREFSIIKKIALAKFQSFPEHLRESDGASRETGGVSAPVSGASQPVPDEPVRGLNRRVWAEALEEAELNGQLPAGRAMYAWYKAECQSTCDVERLIGVVKKHMRHADSGCTLLRDLTTVVAFGPKTKEDLATRKVVAGSVHLVPTLFLQRCNEIWLANFGRRFGVNTTARRDKHTTRVKRKGTDKSIADAVRKGRHALVDKRYSDLNQEAILPGLSTRSLAGRGRLGGRTVRQKAIAQGARRKIAKLRQDPMAGGTAGVSAAAPSAKAKAKAKANAHPPTTRERHIYSHELLRKPRLLSGCEWETSVLTADVIVVQDLSVVQQARDNADACLPEPLLWAMMDGKRVATPEYFSSPVRVSGMSIRFQPMLRKQEHVFFTDSFKQTHGRTLALFARAAKHLGSACLLQTLVCAAAARALKAVVIDDKVQFSNFVRRLASIDRERGERGRYRLGQ